ncbi:hypothetical protein H257_09460 [Aphanomyces astaci]|uniref:Uncharacterized protein n=2 Tax=Aphanomyces astaci TaxID=112090 RepID=W4GBI5_APHAT|nr:hypothetical protein H257_09460 [Aphanomyces astaci]ETV76434.1 hypothetical protein H257_09460 [Aphanomyces astaci]|eukprot:XP_009833979.1 hypothetical protein H257_09460 [Aphanomyces astaci]
MAESNLDEQSLWRDRNKILVAGLPMNADDAALAAKFESFGAMFQAKVVLDNNTRKSRGFGFVTFQTYESALDAVRGLDQSKWDKRVLNVRFLTPKTGSSGAPTKAAAPVLRVIEPRPEGCTTVFVGNMPYEITEDLLKKVMGVCGEIKAIRFAEDITTKEFRGFGYVQFFEGDACEKAVQTLHGAVVMGRPLKVDYGARDAPQVTEAKEALQKKLKKGICHKFQHGLCDRGDSCKFAHVEPVTSTTIDLGNYPTTSTKALNNVPDDAPVCMAFQNGKCKRGDQCNYRHIPGANGVVAPQVVADERRRHVVADVDEESSDDDDDDTPVCLAFQKGKCKRGDLCKYRHKSASSDTSRASRPAPVVVAAVRQQPLPPPVRQVAVPSHQPTSIPVVRATSSFNTPSSTAVDDSSIPICQSFQKGTCKRGNQCKYRHEAASATTATSQSRHVDEPSTPANATDENLVCQRFLLKGKCKRGDMCKYVHKGGETASGRDDEEAVAPPPQRRARDPEVARDDHDEASSVPICQSFQKGTCKRGNKCKFRHVAPKEQCQRYLQGKCTKGSQCAFSHDDAEEPPAKKPKY